MADEIAHLTQTIYKKNLELEEQRKILTLLRKIYKLILESGKKVEHIANQITYLIISNTNIKSVFLYLFDEENNFLRPLSVAFAKTNLHINDDIHHLYYSSKISMEEKNNPLIQSINSRKILTENRMVKFFNQISADEVEKNQQQIGIKQFIIYPFFVHHNIVGSIVFGLNEDQLLYDYWKNLIFQLSELITVAISNSILYNKVQENNEKLKELDNLKDEFVSIASHELRTPMTAIKSYIWLAINKSVEKMDDEVVRYLHTAYQATERLLHLVEQMLTISRIEGKRLQLTMTKFDLTEIIIQLYNELLVKAEEKNIEFKYQFNQKPIILTGDVERIRETLQNIIGNALKFTPENGKILTTAAITGKKVIISVFNSGSYISELDMPKLFKKFGRLQQNDKEERVKSGSGLGLYICKQIVDLHRGSISVFSEKNKGTTFEITLPVLS